jgi:hypothetical protein
VCPCRPAGRRRAVGSPVALALPVLRAREILRAGTDVMVFIFAKKCGEKIGFFDLKQG